MRTIYGALVVMFAIVMWVCGMGFVLSVAAYILKILGLGIFGDLTLWVPLKFAAGWVVGLFGISTSMAYLATSD